MLSFFNLKHKIKREYVLLISPKEGGKQINPKFYRTCLRFGSGSSTASFSQVLFRSTVVGDWQMFSLVGGGVAETLGTVATTVSTSKTGVTADAALISLGEKLLFRGGS